MLKYTLRRLAYLFPTLLGITFVTFVIISLAPGDPFGWYLRGINRFCLDDEERSKSALKLSLANQADYRPAEQKDTFVKEVNNRLAAIADPPRASVFCEPKILKDSINSLYPAILKHRR